MDAVLGLNCYKHDSAAVLLVDGVPAAAVEEERLSRVKHSGEFPARAVRWCLESAGIAPEQLGDVAFYMRPGLVLRENATYWPPRLLVARGRVAFLGFLGSQLWAAAKMAAVPDALRALLGHPLSRTRFHFVEHHTAHAASAFFASGFPSAAVLTLDGVGERDTGTGGVHDERGYRVTWRARFPHSPGFFYSAVTAYLGFRPDSDEYKVMGLAAHGRPRHADLFRRLLRVDGRGRLRLETAWFGFPRGVRGQLFGQRLVEALGSPRREGETIEERHADVAASAQQALEDAALDLARRLRRETGEERLVLAGGVTLNCVMNGRLLREAGFREVYPMPAAHDAGAALGAAWHVDRVLLGRSRPLGPLPGVLLGPEFGEAQIEAELREDRLLFTRPADIAAEAAGLLAEGRVVGWFEGRAEFGPRALGNRSILADPRRAEMRERVNACVKRREEFRPFAPSVLEEEAGRYFEGCGRSPYMILVFRVVEAERERIPAVTHLDGTARVHTVSREANPLYRRLIEEFQRLTGVPLLLNTSFNLRGEPIVTTPREAVRTFYGSGMDALVIGPFLVVKP